MGRLVGIDYIRVNRIDGIEKAVEIYGSVIVTDPCSHTIVYHRASVKAERLVGEYIPLPGPSRPISGLDQFTISVNLWAKLWDHDGTKITKEIAKGMIAYCSFKRYTRSYEEDVLGEDGGVSLGYSVIRESLITTINVVMLNESPPASQIYGTIKASRFWEGRLLFDKSTRKWVEMNPQQSGSTTTILFDKSASECVQVNPQESIPVAAFAIPVSVHSHLKIEVDLWDHHGFSSDNQIVLGSLQFTPKVGTQKKIITGEYGQVQVCITCNDYS